jgi:hypothetical protein
LNTPFVRGATLLSVAFLSACSTDLRSASAPARVAAFPGAEGAGAYSLGGRGGRVIKVTNLADSGPGSLRAAVEAEGPRVILFDIGGTIALKKPLKVTNGRVTIAGQSAPGGGIALRDQPFIIEADDVVVRYIRVRLGDESRTEADAFSIVSGARIIVDHVSASWSVDETLSAGSPGTDAAKLVRDVTVQWSIISESLNKSAHAKGDHGYGSLVRAGFGARLSFHHNLWAHHNARMPRPGNYNEPKVDPTGPLMEFRSNLFYNWGGKRSGYNADKTTLIAYNFIDNSYVTGPNSGAPIAFEESNSAARSYFAGNSMNGVVPADPWSLVAGVAIPANRLSAPIDVAPVRTDPAASAAKRILASAGASLPRDSVDSRIVSEVNSRGGRIIDRQSEVGGWPVLAAGSPRPDGDGDGLPDAWEKSHGLNPADPADANGDRNRDGWTNIEEWLADLARQ